MKRLKFCFALDIPGHVMFTSTKNYGLLWTGDVLFTSSIGRTDFPA
jgi:glyoxylase-like metal-dependent hydrolase (beta-lactamase superfamily II)